MGVIKDISSILAYGEMSTSYKHATLLALFDYIAEQPSEAAANNFHFLPLVDLARRFVAYYWPFSYTSVVQGKKLGEGKKVRAIELVEKFKVALDAMSGFGGELTSYRKASSLKESGFKWIVLELEADRALPKPLVRLLVDVRHLILYQPLTYIHNVKGAGVVQCFSVVNNTIPFASDYKAHLAAGMRTKFPGAETWHDLLKAEDTWVIIDDFSYNELAELRFWGRDVVIKAWLEFLAGIGANRGTPDLSMVAVFESIYNRDFLERDSPLVARYKDAYRQIKLERCFYSGSSLVNRAYHLDHFLPWAYYPVNRFWNLVPAEGAVNLEKRAFLPRWTPAVEASMRAHLAACVAHRGLSPIKEDLVYFYETLCKSDATKIEAAEAARIVEQLLTFVRNELKGLERIIPGVNFEYGKG